MKRTIYSAFHVSGLLTRRNASLCIAHNSRLHNALRTAWPCVFGVGHYGYSRSINAVLLRRQSSMVSRDLLDRSNWRPPRLEWAVSRSQTPIGPSGIDAPFCSGDSRACHQNNWDRDRTTHLNENWQESVVSLRTTARTIGISFHQPIRSRNTTRFPRVLSI